MKATKITEQKPEASQQQAEFTQPQQAHALQLPGIQTGQTAQAGVTNPGSAPSANHSLFQPTVQLKQLSPVQLKRNVLALQRLIGNRAVVQLISQQQQTTAIHEHAASGVQGAGSKLPHHDKIQAAFGKYDISHVQAHTGSQAQAASQAIGAQAYATGSKVAFADSSPDLFTAAHEAAHIVQQQAGVQLKGGVGEAGDSYEQHADAVADAVVQGYSAEQLLNKHSNVSLAAGNQPIQRLPTTDPTKLATGIHYDTSTNGLHNGKAVPTKTIAIMKEPADGGVPSVNPPGWDWLVSRFGKLKGSWVRFHIINAKLGGPGNNSSNLVPTTHALNHNGNWRQLEDDAKTSANTTKQWTYEEVELDYDAKFPGGIPKKIDAEWGYWDGAAWKQSYKMAAMSQVNPDDGSGPTYLPANGVPDSFLKNTIGIPQGKIAAAKALFAQKYADEYTFDETWSKADASAEWDDFIPCFFIDDTDGNVYIVKS